MPGPIPKRSEHRRRTNKDGGTIEKLQVSNPSVDQPDPDPSWHRAARNWYLSLAESGQAHYYEPADWQHAWLVAEILSREFALAEDGGKLRAMMLQTVFGEMTNLLTTEGARRRFVLSWSG